MERALTQVLFNFLPESIFRYEDGRAWCRVTQITQREAQNLRPALQESVRDLLANWGALQEQGGSYPDPIREPGRYIAGEPYQVYYTLYPLIFLCKTCRRVHYYENVERLRTVNDRLQCMTSREHRGLSQLPYVFIHECGHLDSLFIPGGHRGHVLHIQDRSSFYYSRWSCETCGLLPTNGLGFRTCVCRRGGRPPAMRGSLLQDSSVYHPHTIGILNIRDDAYITWSRTENATPILLAGICNVPGYDGGRLMEYTQSPPALSLTPAEEAEIRADLEASGIGEQEQQDRFIRQRLERRNPAVAARQALLTRVDTLFENTSVPSMVPDSRAIREFLYARDHPTPNTRSLREVLSEATRQGDLASVQRCESDLTGMRELGLSDIRVMTDLPVVLCAVGFSRWMQEHRRVRNGNEITATLRLFPATQNRFPIYTAENSTEGLLFTLDPFQWAAWLAENGQVDLPATGFTDEASVRAWLLGLMPRFLETDRSYLQRQPWEDTALPIDPVSGLSFGLLHSMSHLFLASAQSYVGFQTDSLSEYLFPLAGSGLIYAGGHKEYTLGGIVSVFQQDLLQWLRGARETAFRCLLDPLCRQKGGACHACVYLRFSCQHFNRTVSRSFLTGGRIPGYAEPIYGYWSSRVRARAVELRVEGVGA